MSPRAVPDPVPACWLGAALFAGMLVASGVVAFVAGVAVCRRVWPELR